MPHQYIESEMEVVGKTNEGWGVCGFTSSMYAMYSVNQSARPWLINAPRAFTVLSEIKGYLRLLQEFDGQSLISDIETFTRTFGKDFKDFSVTKYIDYINRAAQKYVNKSNQESKKIYTDAKFSIALPPNAVADYLKRRCGYDSNVTNGDPGGEAIIGVKDKTANNSAKLYNGLCHWVYRKNGRIYSWGESFDSLADADSDFVPVYYIKIA